VHAGFFWGRTAAGGAKTFTLCMWQLWAMMRDCHVVSKEFTVAGVNEVRGRAGRQTSI
jgi:hypothetical protein